jgi:predicted phosphodiesterase
MHLSRCGLLGDIHAEDERLASALAFFRSRSPALDAILFVGDVVDGEGDLEACVRMLDEAGALGVRGNHERWILADTARSLPHAHRASDLSPRTLELLRALPATRAFRSPIGPVLLCHGVDDDDMARLRPSDDALTLHDNIPFERLRRRGDVAVMLGGHTHERMVRDFGDVVVVNAGTLAREVPEAGFVTLDFEAGRATLHRFAGDAIVDDGTFPIEPGRAFVVPSRG